MIGGPGASVLAAYRNEVLARVGHAVSARGFSGAGEDWHGQGPAGDHGMISLQRNRLSADRLAFRVHLAVTPGPWWDYLGASSPPRTAQGLWRQVLVPTVDGVEHRDEQWWLVSDHESARRCRLDVVAGLHSHGFAQVERLLQRPGLLDTVRRGDLGRRRPFPHTLLTELLLLSADDGDVDAFTHQAAALREVAPGRYADLLEWAERRLVSRSAAARAPEV